MKFINKSTGVILEPNSEFVLEQLSKDTRFAQCEDQPAETPATKPLTKFTKDELLEMANEAGIQVPEGAKKDEIIKLIEESASNA